MKKTAIFILAAAAAGLAFAGEMEKSAASSGLAELNAAALSETAVPAPSFEPTAAKTSVGFPSTPAFECKSANGGIANLALDMVNGMRGYKITGNHELYNRYFDLNEGNSFFLTYDPKHKQADVISCWNGSSGITVFFPKGALSGTDGKAFEARMLFYYDDIVEDKTEVAVVCAQK